MQREDLIVGKKYITHANTVIQISTNTPNLVEAFWPSGRIYRVSAPSKLKEFTVDIGDRVNFTKADALIDKYYEVIDIIGTNVVFKKGSEKITGSIAIESIYKICKKEKSQNMLFKENYNPFDWEIMVTNLPSESIIWVMGNKTYEYLINKNAGLDGKEGIFISKCRIKGEDKWQGYISLDKRVKTKEIVAFCKPPESKTNIEVIRRDLCSYEQWASAITNLKQGDIIHCSGNQAYEYMFYRWSSSSRETYKISDCRKKGYSHWTSYPKGSDSITAEITAIFKLDYTEEVQQIQEIQMEKNWKEFDKENLKAGMEDAKAEIAARQRAQAKAKYTELFNSLETVNSQIETLQVTKKEIEEALVLFQ